MSMNAKKIMPIQIASLLIIFILPVIVGWLLFHYHTQFHFRTMNYGILVNPPVRAEFLYAGTLSQREKKWRVIHLQQNICDKRCETINYQLRQVQKALGKNRERVLVLAVSPPVNGNINQFNKIYLVDPMGNLFMYYPDTTNPMNVLKDLQKVLEVSQIG